MRNLLAIGVVIMLFGCAQQITQQQISDADAICAKQSWRTWGDVVICYSQQERPVWMRHNFRNLDLFDQMDGQRKGLAAALDSKQISPAEYQSRFQTLIRQFIATVNARDDARQEQYAENDRRIGQALLSGIAASAQMRANADGAALQAQQQRPPLFGQQTTTCQRNAINQQQVDCTTTNY